MDTKYACGNCDQWCDQHGYGEIEAAHESIVPSGGLGESATAEIM